jgi:hypothetical protein
MGASLSTLDAALKETWTESKLAEQLYNENPLPRARQEAQEDTGRPAGSHPDSHQPQRWFHRPAGGWRRAERRRQPGPHAGTWQYKHQHQQVSIQGEVIDGTANDTLSVAEAVDLEVSGAVSDLNRQLTRQLFLNGDGMVCAVRGQLDQRGHQPQRHVWPERSAHRLDRCRFRD